MSSHSKFIISNFLWTKNALKSDETRTLNSNWFYKLGFRNRLQAIVMLISCPAWVRSLSTTGVKVEGDSLG